MTRRINFPAEWDNALDFINNSFATDSDLDALWTRARELFFKDDETLQDAFGRAWEEMERGYL